MSGTAGTATAAGRMMAAHLADAGYGLCEPSILQPAAIFLDLSGEEIRSRMYLTSDPSGAELCLRPEYTIPVCRDYLASQADAPASYSYFGPVFRHRSSGSGEALQVGLESFGRADKEAADAEILTLALEAVRAAGGPSLIVRIGDTGLFDALLDKLPLSPAWRRRITRGHARGDDLDRIFAPGPNGSSSDHSGVLAALEGVDKAGALALVEDLLSIAGISAVGGRSPNEIAERFLEQSSLKASADVSLEIRNVIERFLRIEGNIDQASEEMRALFDEAGLDMRSALDIFDTRFEIIIGYAAARGLDVNTLSFSAGFARHIDYYTGFVFEAHDPSRPEARPVIGGGRYDRLMSRLGASNEIPAVGAAIWCERLFAETVR